MDEEKNMNTELETLEDSDKVRADVEHSSEGENVDTKAKADESELQKEVKEESTEEVKEDTETSEIEEFALEEDSAEELEPELQILDGEDLEVSEEEPVAHSGKLKSVLKKAAFCVVGVLLVVYIGFAIYFTNHFGFNTTVNGTDQSLKSVEQVEEYFEQQVEQYQLILKEVDNKTEVISGAEISMTYDKGTVVEELVKSQSPWVWPMNLFSTQELKASVGVAYDEGKLDGVIAALACMDKENQTAPVSAVPKYNGSEFEVAPEQLGSQIEEEVFVAKVKEALQGFLPELDMPAEECYVKAKYSADSPEVIEACEQMNKYLTAKITYKLGSKQEIVDHDVIQEWLVVKDSVDVSLSAEKIKSYIAGLADKYDTYGKSRTFTSASGRTVTVSGGSYGWQIDQNAEYKAVVEAVKNHETVEREPKYKRTAAQHDGLEWGNTYVEVDLSGQRVYLVKNGNVILNTPCVTGNVNNGWYTPQGVYSISYCAKNVTLRGPKRDGKYEWESPVTFWMPFNGSIGLHDASWQTSFGNPNGYLITGSRGCVNLQYDAASTIYANVSAGTPVICYF